ncbi:MAG: O-antigen ligase family protein [Candidatus Accumulibacter sp.]|uniref:O-antigen ligase family protein n=1 Tax=Accumulibacter sp. TaxID=2053492 RepID=UPI001ACC9203|nr:O-antigen ligase family protein [Accumulibacter sp.]MBN8439063.1 O-antigen ligase family protein [Accumulibacter sp.]
MTLTAIFFTFRARSYEQGLLPVIAVSLFNIPVVMFGNSASAGIFPVDVVFLVFFIRFFFLSKSRIIFSCINTVTAQIFVMLWCWALIRGLLVLIFDEYEYYDRFVVYGIYRWTFFALIFFAFLQMQRGVTLKSLLMNLSIILAVYYVFAIPHQVGLFDLSGWSAISSKNNYDTDYLAGDVYRSFLGNNAATVGCISVVGILLGVVVRETNKIAGRILVVLAIASLMGSGSRSDIIALILALIVWLMAFGRIRHLTNMAEIVLLGSVVMLGFLGMFDVYGLERFLGTDLVGESAGTSDGTFAYRIFWWREVVSHLGNDFSHLVCGYGPNAFRMMSVYGVAPLSYGHNLYLHTLGELGLIGILLLLLFVFSAFFNIFFRKRNHQDRDVRLLIRIAAFLILQRLFAGLSVDSIFAVDNMIAMSALVLFIIAAAISVVKTPLAQRS